MFVSCTSGSGGGGDGDLTSTAELGTSTRAFNVDGEARVTPSPCFAVGELLLSGGKDSGSATGDSCAAAGRIEVRFTVSLRLSTLCISADFGESVAMEAEELLRGGV